ncbi:substrate-binding periplasmic protein [Ningiella sp. W23]|uniref:substrate-binding periplasmic protein n=1 Tax=Ningiella sp. W23 TaxID=3023715 RepID=UPI0037571C6F
MKASLSMLLIVLSFALISCSQEQRQSEQESSSEPIASETNMATQAIPEPTVDIPPPLPECSLRMGFDIWSPYQYVDVDDNVRGLDIEIVTSVTDTMGCDVEFVQGTWVSLLNDLRNGDVDVLLGASKTQAREEFAFFSEPYRMETFALYVRRDDESIAGLSDINSFIDSDKKIGVVSDYFYGDQVSALFDGENTADQFVFSIMGELNIARLLDMDIDGFLEDEFVGASMLRQKALSGLIVESGYTIETGDIYVMFSKASVDPTTVERFDEALTDFKNSAQYTDTVNKYKK